MTRILGLVALAVVVWIFLEFAWNRVRSAMSPAPPPPKMPTPAPPERLVRCEVCNSHVPANRTLTGADGRVLCERCDYNESP